MDAKNQESQEKEDNRFKTEEKRDDKGRFVEGTAQGPGRQSGKSLKEY